jgi:hypothetical protein
MKRVIFIAALAVSLVSVSSCSLFEKDVKIVGKDAKSIVVDCGKQAIQDAIPNLLPQVNQILIDTTKTIEAKAAALDKLAATTPAIKPAGSATAGSLETAVIISGTELLACAVREAIADVVNASKSIVAGSSLPPSEVTAVKSTGEDYLRGRYTFSDGYLSPVDGGAGQ